MTWIFSGCEAHLEKRTPRDCGGDGDRVGGGVDLFFANGDVRLVERLREVPAAILVGDDVFLKPLVGGAAIADEDTSVGLHVCGR